TDGAHDVPVYVTIAMFTLFFFSSRRRHTRVSRDWSSDVCSSDLFALLHAGGEVLHPLLVGLGSGLRQLDLRLLPLERHLLGLQRSEERRVGKDCCPRRSLSHHTTIS